MFPQLPPRSACFSVGPAADPKATGCIVFGLLAVYLVFLPIGHTAALRNLAFFSLLFVTLWSTWRHGLHLRFPLAWPWVLYGAVSLFSLAYAFDPLWSLGEIKKELGYGMLSLVLAATWVRNGASLEKLLGMVIAGNLLVVGVVLCKATVMDPFWQRPLFDTINGNLLNDGAGKSIYNGVGNLSTYLVTTLPLIAAYAFLRPASQRPLRHGLMVLLGLDLLALLLSGNRMGWLALMVEALLAGALLASRQKGVQFGRILFFTGIFVVLLAAMGAVVMQVRPPVSDPRWQIWSWAVEDILAHPFSGSGFGRTVMRAADPGFYQAFGLEHTHNMVLNKGVQMGVPGMIAFLVLLGAAFHALWPRRALPRPLWAYAVAATAMSAGVFVKNMTDDFFVAHNALLYWTLAGAVLGALAGHRESSET